MYKIIKDGATLAQVEAPSYVRRQNNGLFVTCEERDAQGIVHNGTVYHLLGRADLEGRESVTLEQFDAGAELENTKQTVEDADAMNVDQEYRLTLLELEISEAEAAE